VPEFEAAIYNVLLIKPFYYKRVCVPANPSQFKKVSYRNKSKADKNYFKTLVFGNDD